MNFPARRTRLWQRLTLAGRWSALLAMGLALLLALSLAQAQPALPELSEPVIDTTGTLDAAQRQQLERKLRAFEQSHGTQIVLLLVPSTQPEDIFSYANRVANHWKIGRKDVGDGVLLLVAKNDRQVRIEVAKALEGAIPDLAAQRIIDQAITPRFRQGDFAGGLDAALDQLMARISGEALPAPAAQPSQRAAGLDWQDLAIFLFVALPLLAGLARRLLGPGLGALATGVGALALLFTASLLLAALAALVALLFTLFSNFAARAGGIGRPSGGPGGWRAGGGGGFGGGFGGRGGGFGSGGGGNFGGGGASGRW